MTRSEFAKKHPGFLDLLGNLSIEKTEAFINKMRSNHCQCIQQIDYVKLLDLCEVLNTEESG